MDKAGDVLKSLLSVHNEGAAYSSLFGTWVDIVGLSLGEHSRVYDVRHKTLYVEVDHPGWMQMLYFRKEKILAVLKIKFSQLDIMDLKIKVNPQFSRGKEEVRNEAEPCRGDGGQSMPMEENENGEIKDALSSVQDEGLKRSLRKLYQASLKRRKT